MTTNKNNEYSYDKFLSDSSDDYPKYSDGIEPQLNTTPTPNNKKMTNNKLSKLERICWFCGLSTLVVLTLYTDRGWHAAEQSATRYKFLTDAADLEHKIVLGELRSLKNKALESEAEGYTRGYADGAANMGSALVNDDESFLNYSDGYHAAVHQFGYQTNGLSLESSKINSQLGEFENLLRKKQFDAAAIELTDVIVRLESRLEDVFMDSALELVNEEELLEQLDKDIEKLETESDTTKLEGK